MLDPKKYKTKGYTHLDYKTNIKKAESYVMNPKRIETHSFLPFIHYVSSFDKNIGAKNPGKQNRPIKSKKRDIMYAGHLDNFIYKYYAENLNRKYNKWTDDNEIDECSTAYRDNKNGKSNIEFAGEVINSIVNYESAFILVGDFTKFFDKINHRILKRHLINVLDVKMLSKDWYNIYRSITKYGYYEKDYLLEKLNSDQQFKINSRQSYFNSVKEFRKFQRKHPCKKNKNTHGIPQGTAISAVFANVYAIVFDTAMKKLSNRYGGMYRRYSDDFVLVVPKVHNNKSLTMNGFLNLEREVWELAEINGIELQESKTELLEYENRAILSSRNYEKNRLDYLGFIFDGETVKMRGKSPYKFYREAYKLINQGMKTKFQKDLNKIPYRKRIYGLYTDLGIERGTYGNFITYAKRAQASFDKISPNTNNIMMKQIKNRKKKIEKKLGFKLHT